MQLSLKETQVCAVFLFSYTSIARVHTRVQLSMRYSTNEKKIR